VNEFFDSSGKGNHAQGGGGVDTQTPARTMGKIGYGQNGDGNDDFIATPIRLAGQSTLTVTAWFYARSVTNTSRPGLLGQDNALEIGFYWSDRLNVWTSSITTTCPGKSIVSACTPDFALHDWMHFAIVFDGIEASLFLNGEKKHVVSTTGVGSNSSFFHLMGRVFDSTGNSLDGILDETRIAVVPRSSEWIATEHANQSNPAGFYFVGPEQSYP
jgi:hypothetical protein